jgi:hypothetical protein
MRNEEQKEKGEKDRQQRRRKDVKRMTQKE